MAAGQVRSRRDVDATLDEAFAKTLGRLVRTLPQHVQLGPEDRALEARNRLAHSFFRDKAMLLFTEDGRWGMVEQLQAMVDLFQDVDEALTRHTLGLGRRFGITEELWEQTFSAMKRDAQAG
jgi:hypothetical protein